MSKGNFLYNTEDIKRIVKLCNSITQDDNYKEKRICNPKKLSLLAKEFTKMDKNFSENNLQPPLNKIEIIDSNEMLQKRKDASVCAFFDFTENVIYLNLSELRNPFCMIRNFVHEERHKFQYFSE